MFQEYDADLISRFHFEGEVLSTDIGTINGSSVIITIDDLRDMQEGQDFMVTAKRGNIDLVSSVIYKTKVKEDGLVENFAPYVPKEYLSKAKEIWEMTEIQLHNQLSDINWLLKDNSDGSLELRVEKINDDYYLALTSEDKASFNSLSNGNLEIEIKDVFNFDAIDIHFRSIEARYEIEFFSDIISSDIGTIQANILSLDSSDLSQLGSNSKIILAKSGQIKTPQTNTVISIKDQVMHSNLKGKIILQVESNGEAWYINPVDNRRYFLGRPADAFEIMRTLGLGISNDNLDKLIDIEKEPIGQESDFNCGDDLEFVYNGQEVVYKTILKNDLCWLDRNLGAQRACLTYNDSACYGDYFQWGRGADGHQIKSSQTSPDLAVSINPGHNKFILNSWPYQNNGDWLANPNDNLWQGVNGINNPCPSGWRVPTDSELKDEQQSWTTLDILGAYQSSLRWPTSMYRDQDRGEILGLDRGYVWSSDLHLVGSEHRSGLLWWGKLPWGTSSFLAGERRANGFPLRCVMDLN